MWFLAGWILMELALWGLASGVWALGLWKLDRNIRRREQLNEVQ